MDNVKIIEDNLAANPQINLKELMELNRASTFKEKQPILPYLCEFCAIRHLNAEGSLNKKIAKVHAAIKFTDPLKGWKDEQVVFAYFLAKRCSSPELMIVMESFRDFKGTTQRMAEQFLSIVLKSRDPDSIQHAFAIYWSCYEIFDAFLPKSEWTLLEDIDDEEVLKTVYAHDMP